MNRQGGKAIFLVLRGVVGGFLGGFLAVFWRFLAVSWRLSGGFWRLSGGYLAVFWRLSGGYWRFSGGYLAVSWRLSGGYMALGAVPFVLGLMPRIRGSRTLIRCQSLYISYCFGHVLFRGDSGYRGLAVIWRFPGGYLAVIWRFPGGYLAVIWRLLAVIWRFPGGYLAVIWRFRQASMRWRKARRQGKPRAKSEKVMPIWDSIWASPPPREMPILGTTFLAE